MSALFDHCQTETFQGLLDTLEAEAAPTSCKRRILILDNASWHKTKRLNWHGFEPAYLPPYSPDSNPIFRPAFRLRRGEPVSGILAVDRAGGGISLSTV